MDSILKIRKRAKILLVIFFLWAVLIILYLFYSSIIQKKTYLNSSDSISKFYGIMPAPRGNIYDKNKSPLAWTMTVFKVIFPKKILNDKQLFMLKKIIPGLSLNNISSNQFEIKYLTENDLTLLLEKYPLLKEKSKIELIYKRGYVENKYYQNMIGTTKLVDNKLVGVSGLEKEYNIYLQGIDGKFEVIKDKNGKWILSTFKETVKMEPGKNLYLNQSIEKLKK